MTRWDGLFADLEAQWAAEEAAGVSADIDARTRGELAEVALVDRLRAAQGQPVRVVLAGAHTVTGGVQRVGPDWFAVLDELGRETVVVTAALEYVTGLTRWSQSEAVVGAVTARLGLRSALRAVVRDRSAVRLLLTGGTTVDATLDRVGADHVEAAVHAPGESRRARAVRAAAVVPFSALAAVRRDAVD